MYANKDPKTSPITLWRFPNTISGDAAVTIFIETVVSWLITAISVNADLHSGSISPIAFMPQPNNRFLRWYCYVDAEVPAQKKNFKQWLVFIGSQIVRALAISVPCFFLIWPAAMGIMTSSTLGSHRGSDYYYSRRWTPQIFKLLEGGILSLLQNPLFVLLWLSTAGWKKKETRREAVGETSQITTQPVEQEV